MYFKLNVKKKFNIPYQKNPTIVIVFMKYLLQF